MIMKTSNIKEWKTKIIRHLDKWQGTYKSVESVKTSLKAPTCNQKSLFDVALYDLVKIGLVERDCNKIRTF